MDVRGSLRRPPPWTIGAAVIVILLVLGAVATLVIERMGQPLAAPNPGPSRGSIVGEDCVQIRRPGGDDYCGRIAADRARRAELSAAQRARIAATLPAVNAAARNPGCGWPEGNPPGTETVCLQFGMREREPQAPGPGHVRAIQASLTAAGFADSTVRIAGAEDPAPLGSVMFGVPIGDGCAVGSVMVDLKMLARAVGKLPNGYCL